MARNTNAWQPALGAIPVPGGTRFCVWAPATRQLDVVLQGDPGRLVRLSRDAEGYFTGTADGVGPGTRYHYRLGGSRLLPDPASRFQPEGVHGPSEVVDPSAFAWSDQDWRPVNRDALVIYELHVGTFAAPGTFEAVRARLPEIVALGVTAVELMPVAEFPGARNWGYDGVALFAPSRAYGRPDDLRRLVDAAHAAGLAVLLDVVYNHFGPEGAYHAAFSPDYFTGRYRTPWGNAINLDGRRCRPVRRFFIENALHWLHEYHVDGFRLDAAHALMDGSSPHFLRELTAELRRAHPDVIVIAEDERKAPELIRPAADGGFDLDGVWADDLHHQLRRLLAGDHEGYFAKYSGTTYDIAATMERGWFVRHTLDGRAETAADVQAAASQEPLTRFVVCLQNHDQVGNRALGDRLHHTIEPAAFRAATALLLLAPETPLLFMGQEWGSSSPFRYFTDHPEPLGSLVTAGRREEFGAFAAFRDATARARIPDPQTPSTWEASRLVWEERGAEPHASLLRLHQRLLHLRRTHPALRPGESGRHGAAGEASPGCVVRAIDADTVGLRRTANGASLTLVVRLRGAGAAAVPHELAGPGAETQVVLTTEDAPFTTDPAPPALDVVGGRVQVTFARPGGVLLTC